jgi:hypothetical protein
MYVLYVETAPWVRMEFSANRTHDCKAQHIRTASHEHDTDDRFKLKATVMAQKKDTSGPTTQDTPHVLSAKSLQQLPYLGLLMGPRAHVGVHHGPWGA